MMVSQIFKFMNLSKTQKLKDLENDQLVIH